MLSFQRKYRLKVLYDIEFTKINVYAIELDSKMYVGHTVHCSHCVDPRLVQNLLDRFS